MYLCFPEKNKIIDFVSASKNIFRSLFPQLNISSGLFPQLKICLLAETKTESISTCGNKIKDFILLGKTNTNIFLLPETKPKIFFCLRKQNIFLLRKTITETLLLAETKPKIFFCL